MRRALAVMLLVTIAGCGGPDGGTRERLLSTESARGLVGAWDITLTADTHALALRLRQPPSPVRGTVVFALAQHAARTVEQLPEITHEGAYDLDVSSFGFTTRGEGEPPEAVARVAGRPAPQGDSIWVVLSPGTARFAMTLRGLLLRDSAAGAWSAQSYRSAGGAGRFVMSRHVAPR